MCTSKYSLFISFEGIDGCGKSTQAKLLAEKLEKHKINSFLVREPGGTLISEKIRNILLNKELEDMNYITEALLMIASRAQLVDEIIIPKLKKGYVVIADRYRDSTLSYQGAGRNLDIDLLDKINSFATTNLMPDITFLMDIPSKIWFKRRRNAKHDRIEKIGDKFQEKVRRQYLKLANDNDKRFVILDGSLSIDNIHNDIFLKVFNKLKSENN